MNTIKTLTLITFFCLTTGIASAKDYASLKGQLRDAQTGEDLIGATVFINELNTGTTTNEYGFYSLRIPKGAYTITFSYIGYESHTKTIKLHSNKVLNTELGTSSKLLGEVVISGEERPDQNIKDVRMSSDNLRMDLVKSLPAFLGETDVMKSLVLLPGVSSGGDGSTGFFVRGGNIDQNLILLDEAPVYNASHLMGFFSVFNADALKDVQIYKGGMPANYGGRLSSVVDIRMKEGNSRDYALGGGVGSIASRLTFEGPIQKEVSSFMLSGRRTYADLFLPLASDSSLRDNKLYFYDLNTKANYRFSDNNRLFISGYFGRDVLKFNDEFSMGWGNNTATMRWNHIFNSKIFSNFTLIYSHYDYLMGFDYGVNGFNWTSDIHNYSIKADFTWYPNTEHTVKFGLQSIYHSFNPANITGQGDQSAVNDFSIPGSNALEQALYISNEQRITHRLALEYGLRYSLFSSLGKNKVYQLDDDYNITGVKEYDHGEIYHHDHGAEPRFSLAYTLSANQSVKASYNRTRQYLQQTNVTATGTPLDIWFPASPNVKAQTANQWAIGYFRHFMNHTWETSLETYYKNMNHQLDFKDHAEILLNPKMEADLRAGKAWSYGAEFLIQKTQGPFKGWFSYTWSRTWQQIEEINHGEKYPAAFDRPHDLSVALSYDISTRINIAANWVYHSGKPVTLPIGRYEYGNVVIPFYADRNDSRLPDYHRLDLSLTIHSQKKPDRRWEGSWNFSVYNAYHQKNIFSYTFRQNEDNVHQTDAYKLYLFGILPSVTYNFKF